MLHFRLMHHFNNENSQFLLRLGSESQAGNERVILNNDDFDSSAKGWEQVREFAQLYGAVKASEQSIDFR